MNKNTPLSQNYICAIGADGVHVAQALVPPSERLLIIDGDQRSLKLDVRCYVYDGQVQLHGARMYRGQMTNFRTDGGGLAAVFTAPITAVSGATRAVKRPA